MTHVTTTSMYSVLRHRNNTFPRLFVAFFFNELIEILVGFHYSRHGFPHNRVCNCRIQCSDLDIMTEKTPVSFQEMNGADKSGGEDGADAKNPVTIPEVAEHMRIMANLERGRQSWPLSFQI